MDRIGGRGGGHWAQLEAIANLSAVRCPDPEPSAGVGGEAGFLLGHRILHIAMKRGQPWSGGSE